jgi:M6 family metalloprotease-like protein
MSFIVAKGIPMKKRICPPRIYGSIFVLGLLISLSATFSAAQTGPQNTEPPAAARMRVLNNSLLRLHGQMQQAGPNDVALLRNQAANVIAQRAAALSKLIQSDAHAALSFAFSPELLGDLAAKFPNVAGQFESHTTLSGPIERWVIDYADLKSSRSLIQMKVGQQKVNLYFAGQEPGNLRNGDVIQATGVVVGSEMAVETSVPVQSGTASSRTGNSSPLAANNHPHSQQWATSALLVLGFVLGWPRLGGKIRLSRARLLSFLKQFAIYGLVFALFVFTSTPIYAQNSCSTTGVQQVAVLVVTFPGISVPTFSPSLSDQFFGPAPSLTSYWQETSYGVTSATGNVFGPFTLTGTYSCSNMTQFVDDALSAAAVSGLDFNTYNRVDIVFPGMNPSCGWAGLSSIGCYAASTSAGTFNISVSVLDWTKFVLGTIYHENGHQLGLAHSRLRTFGSDVLGPLGVTGTLTEYGDHYATMGSPNPGHYATGQKAEILGWLTSGTAYQTVTSSGTYVLQPYETQAAGLNAIKIQRGTGNPGYYLWIEYRQPIGNYDSTMPYSAEPSGNVFTGALIHYEDSVTGPQTDLLDFTIPDTYADYPALSAGQIWTDSYSDLSLSVVSATPAGLTVNVNYSGSVSCTHANPSITLAPSNPSIYPGNSAAYNVTVTNNDSAGCSAGTFNMGSTQPSGWPTSFSVSSVTLSPGQSGTLTLTKTGPAGTPPGTYLADANASNNSNVGSGTANVTVMSPPSLTVSVSVPASSFALRSTVPIIATVLNGGAPASGANVTFTLTGPTGSTTTQTATTSSSGTATWGYKLGPKSLTGTYSVTAQATLSSGSRRAGSTQTAISNTVKFAVQ